MIRLVARFIFMFFGLLLLQVLLLNNLHLSIFINPYVYILVVLLLPFDIPEWLLLSAAFVAGLIMDAFSNTMGMHTASLVMTAFLRKYLLIIMAPREGYNVTQLPHFNNMGIIWFLSYSGFLVITYHLSLFLIEDFRFGNFFTLLFKAIASSMLSLIVMLVLMLFAYKPR